jgi:DnaJ homolog subfamily B member 4
LLEKGTKITLPGKGNQHLGAALSDLVFVVNERPPALFKRDENYLVIIQKTLILEALGGKTLNMIALD